MEKLIWVIPLNCLNFVPDYLSCSLIILGDAQRIMQTKGPFLLIACLTACQGFVLIMLPNHKFFFFNLKYS